MAYATTYSSNRLRYLALLATLLSAAAAAGDLDRNDPDRAQILDAARKLVSPGPEPVKFVVRELFKDADMAYLCALVQSADGHFSRTDEAYDVYQLGLRKQGNGWLATEVGGDLAASPSSVDCRFKRAIEIRSASDIKALIEERQAEAKPE